MKRFLLLLLSLSLLLSGCGWMAGSYVSVVPYDHGGNRIDPGITAISTYQELRSALILMVENGEDRRILSLVDYPTNQIRSNLNQAIRNVLATHPIAAYAVENINYDIGNTGGVTAVAVTVEYNHNRSQLRELRQVNGMETAKSLVTGALERLEPDVVFLVTDYSYTDFDQFIRDYAQKYPDIIMEMPQVIEYTYPNTGPTRVVEITFSYETSRDSLKSMQSYVRPRFASASMFVSGEEIPEVRYQRLYAFLMETSEYTFETSITPTYSLLRHSVGDSRAFASVYAAMCRRSNLECHVVRGTREGESWSWNMIQVNGKWYHLDLVDCYLNGGYRLCYDEDMTGYVWDYTAYPSAQTPEPPPETTEPPQEQDREPEPTQGETESPEETTEPTEETTEPTQGETEPPEETTEPPQETTESTEPNQ